MGSAILMSRASRLPQCAGLLLLAVLAGLSCTEGTGPQSLGQLRIRPVFGPGEEPGALGVALYWIHLVLSRTDGATVADTTLPYIVGETTSWLLDLTDPPESIVISAELGQAAAKLYEGSDQASVETGIGPSSTQHDLPVRYLGTGATFTIDVVPDTAGLDQPGDTMTFAAIARDANGAALTGFAFAWTSSRPEVATVNSATGFVTAVAPGRTEISAVSGGTAGVAILTVGGSGFGAPISIVVTPPTASIPQGSTQQFSATALDAGGNVVPGISFAWTSASISIATVSGTGLATALSTGTTTIVASAGSLSGSATLTVEQGQGLPVRIVVSPPTASITALGGTQQFQASAVDRNGQVVPGVPFTWTSSDPTVATVSVFGGLASAISTGTVKITASAGTLSGSATLGVTQVARSISVTPDSATVATGDSSAFTAVARDANGHVIPGVVFTWSATNASIATVSSSGVATGIAGGTTLVNASTAGVSGSATLTSVDIGSIEIGPALESLINVNTTLQFTAVVRDVAGNVFTAARVTWTSSNPPVAPIDPVSGLATGLTPGTAWISATAGNVTARVWLKVLYPGDDDRDTRPR